MDDEPKLIAGETPMQGSLENYPNGNKAAVITVQERERKALAAKEGVRRRRGPRMQVLPQIFTV